MSVLFIVFDSVLNTVFFSQILLPAIDLSKTTDLVQIISFEKNVENAISKINEFGVLPDNLKIDLIPRGSYLGNWSLYFLSKKIQSILSKNKFGKIICRGVFAAKILEYLLLCLESKDKFIVTILVPGIASEEVLLEVGVKSWIFSYFIKKIEYHVFSNNFLSLFNNLEKKYVASSDGLKDFLISNYNLKPEFVDVLSEEEFVVDQSKKAIARQEVFLELGFLEKDIIYCYSGGMQRWQSFDLTLKKFLEIKSVEPSSMLLVLTLDKLGAQNKLDKAGLKSSDYRLISRSAQDVEKYLLASDCGMIMRESNIVNWTSRPIKAVEYLRAGLKIIHNGTVQWIVSRQNNKLD